MQLAGAASMATEVIRISDVGDVNGKIFPKAFNTHLWD
jgi:hypothetical protein